MTVRRKLNQKNCKMCQITLDEVWVSTQNGFVYADCEAEFERGVLIHSKGRTYSRPTVDTQACNTYFMFQGRRVYTHERQEMNLVAVPSWFKQWIAKNDIWDFYKTV